MVSVFFMVLRDRKQGGGGGVGGWGGGELYYVKGSNVNVKKIIKPFLYHCEEIEISLI